MNVSRNIAALAVAGALTMSVAPAAQATDPKQDKAHCVSTRESRAGFLSDSPTQAEVERRWEVTGRGVEGILLTGPVWYRWCDRPKGSYVGVYYGSADRARMVLWYNIAKQGDAPLFRRLG